MSGNGNGNGSGNGNGNGHDKFDRFASQMRTNGYEYFSPADVKDYYADTFDVRASLRSIADATRQHRNLVILTCVLTMALLTLYVIVWPPIYKTTATLMVERDTDPVRDNFYVGWDMFRKDDARTEIELMSSGPVLKQVIERNHLGYNDIYHPFFSHLSHLWQTSLVGRGYHAVKRKILGGDDLGMTPEQMELAQDIVDLHSGVSVEPVGESNVGRLTVEGPNRKVAAIANTLLDVYTEIRRDRYHTEAQKAYDILTKETAIADQDLRTVEAQRLAFEQQHNLDFDLQKETLELTKFTDLEADIASNRAKVAALEAGLGEINKQLASEPASEVVSTVSQPNTIRETLKQKRIEVEGQLIQLRDHYREDSPEVQEAKGDLAKLDALIAAQPEKVEGGVTQGLNTIHVDLLSKKDSIESELTGAKAALAVMESRHTQLASRLSQVPEVQTDLKQIDRQIAFLTDKYQQLKGKQAQAGVSLAVSKATMPSMRVVEYASVPVDKYWPRMKILFPVGLLVGLLLGITAAVVASYASGRVQREHIERGRNSVPLYGTIPVATELRPLSVTSRGNER